MAKTKVLVVDDSALIRNLMKEIIDRSGDLETIGTAADPYVARDMIRSLNPDVLTLDIEMPRMDGLDFLEKIMRLRPMPVVMVSTLTEKGADATFRALELGAVDFVAKPKLGITQGMAECAAEICEKIRAAAASTSYRRTAVAPRVRPAGEAKPAGAEPSGTPRVMLSGTEKIIAIGASTGGTEAIREVLSRLNADCPGVVITQHMPPGFTKSFAERLNAICRITVKEASDGERILPGHAYIAPGGKHLAVAKSGANYLAKVLDDPPVNRHKPSVDVLFSSVATFVGDNAVGVMLTGMGKDGAAGMLEMRRRGAFTLAQDEASCVVFGMPREAISVGATGEVVPLMGIAERVMQHVARAGHHVRV